MYFLFRFVLDQCCVSSKISIFYFLIAMFYSFDVRSGSYHKRWGKSKFSQSQTPEVLRHEQNFVHWKYDFFSASGRIPGGNRICQAVPGDTARSLFSIWSINFHSWNCSDKHEMKIRSDRRCLQPLRKFAHLRAVGEHEVRVVSQKMALYPIKYSYIYCLTTCKVLWQNQSLKIKLA